MRQSRILVIECTFFEADHQTRARFGQHVHIDDLLKLLPDLQNEYIVLTHLTRRTDIRQAKRLLAEKLSPDQRDRIHFFMSY
jgi:ribonuclease BN (tRNA processing enzyme)